MKNLISVIFIVFAFVSCKNNAETKSKKEAKNDTAEIKIQSYNYSELEPFLSKSDEKTYVVNFWATWCAPCIKELPAFEKLRSNYKNKNVEVLLVSLDFSTQIESNLLPFIKKRKLKSKVVVLDDPNQDEWIPKISEKWSGAIPATLIYNAKKREFYEQSFHYNELETEVLKFLN